MRFNIHSLILMFNVMVLMFNYLILLTVVVLMKISNYSVSVYPAISSVKEVYFLAAVKMQNVDFT